MRIGIDLMGGESSPIHLFESILEASKYYFHQRIQFYLLVTQEIKELIQKTYPCLNSNIFFILVKNTISMSESPFLILRKYPKSSIVLGIHSLKEKKIDAFITCGNTGALVVSAKVILGSLKDIKSPGLLAFMPAKNHTIALIDAGANIVSKAENLVKFATIGGALYSLVNQVVRPKVKLLNIGVEAKKGTIEYQKAYSLLSSSESDYYKFLGNIEPNEIFESEVDVIVCDGFIGNILLKTAEGMVQYLTKDLSIGSKSFPLIGSLEKEKHSGAILCGVKGLILKCHGNATWHSFFGAIKRAIFLIESNYVDKIEAIEF